MNVSEHYHLTLLSVSLYNKGSGCVRDNKIDGQLVHKLVHPPAPPLLAAATAVTAAAAVAANLY